MGLAGDKWSIATKKKKKKKKKRWHLCGVTCTWKLLFSPHTGTDTVTCLKNNLTCDFCMSDCKVNQLTFRIFILSLTTCSWHFVFDVTLRATIRTTWSVVSNTHCKEPQHISSCLTTWNCSIDLNHLTFRVSSYIQQLDHEISFISPYH